MKRRGAVVWRVRWQADGKVKRKFFTTREKADVWASSTRGEAVGISRHLATLPYADQEKLVMVWKECARRGVDILTLLGATPAAPSSSPPISEVIVEMVAAKRRAARTKNYVDNLETICGKFAKGRETLPVNQFTVRELEVFLDDHGINYRATLRARLSTLFKFAVRRGYATANPCERLESVSVTKESPAILTVEETEKLLRWLQEHPRSLAWFVLSCFAGLRPEEAEKTTWGEINFKAGWIRVEAQTSKVRQRRVVYPLPMAIKWLQGAETLKSDLPLAVMSKKRDRVMMRQVLGWEDWKKDVTRHSAASYWLSHTGEAAKIAMALGHSENVPRRNYMALATKAEAEQFWAF